MVGGPMKGISFLALGLFVFSFQASALIGGLFSGSKEAFEIPLGEDVIVIEGRVEGPTFEGQGTPDNPGAFDYWSIVLSDIEVRVKGYNHPTLYLKSEFGWGHMPINHLCAEIGRQLGQPDAVFGDGYGQLGTLSVFSSPTFLVVGKDGGYTISDSEPNGFTYYEGFTCTSREFEY